MCFSATASFGVSAVLIPVGIYATARAFRSHPRYTSFALFPLAFGVQQVFEGMVWLDMDGRAILDREVAALSFTYFSHFFWLLWVPLTVWAVERSRIRKRVGLAVTLTSGLYGASMYLPMLWNEGWLQVVLVQGSIDYKTILIYDGLIPRLVVRAVYAALIVTPLVLCSERYLRLFGVLVAITVAVAAALYGYAFISVWCFFAAVLSLYPAFPIQVSCPRPDRP